MRGRARRARGIVQDYRGRVSCSGASIAHPCVTIKSHKISPSNGKGVDEVKLHEPISYGDRQSRVAFRIITPEDYIAEETSCSRGSRYSSTIPYFRRKDNVASKIQAMVRVPASVPRVPIGSAPFLCRMLRQITPNVRKYRRIFELYGK